ncbi:MAG: MoxR family ATPase [Candidatus Delongbacteria bacterium]|nr:MoxR family ATPase [Candidatus Delongbacteria bacterium]MCG2759602.1 MoxR family ATPase [Candidatus Delongbacteria bacterium]
MNDLEKLKKLEEARDKILANVRKKIIGQQEIIEELLIAIFAGGHVLLTGVPGLAKTLMITTLSETMDLNFKRIQFTPDLMPSDIIGTEILENNRTTGEKELKFIKGPIFSNIILADEINRTPPKTQSALLQAMQEKEVSVGNTTFKLAEPFFVMATRNPIELEGTYPLPEAQLDRFIFNLMIDYPDYESELEIVEKTTSETVSKVEKVLDAQDIIETREIIRKIPVTKAIIEYAVKIVRATRPEEKSASKFIKDSVSWGAGPRAGQNLVTGAKINAVLNGRKTPDYDDINRIAKPVLRHRIIPNFRAEAEGISTDIIIEAILKEAR